MTNLFDELPPVKLQLATADNHWIVANLVSEQALCWRVAVVDGHFVLDATVPVNDGEMRVYVWTCLGCRFYKEVGGVVKMLKRTLAHPRSRDDWALRKTAALAAFGGK